MDMPKENVENLEINSSFDELLNDIKTKSETVSEVFENFKKSNEKMIKDLNEEYQEKIVKSLDDLKNVHQKANSQLIKEINRNDKIVDTYKKFQEIDSDIIRLNVGGTLFSTLKLTLTKKIENPLTRNYYEPNLLEGLVNGFVKAKFDEQRAVFIDRDPKYFQIILNYLRDANSEFETDLPDDLDFKNFKKELQFYNIIGLLQLTYAKLFDSDIIPDYKKKEELFTLCGFDFNKKWKLLYRATRDGFTTAAFHSKCDNNPKTLTIIKTQFGYIFGGYTEVAWDQCQNYKADSNSFLFSLVNKENKPVKIPFKQNNGIYCHAGYGPTFGGGHDFHICNNSNTTNSSYTNLGHSYPHPTHAYNTNEAKTFLAEFYNFMVSDIEVLQLVS